MTAPTRLERELPGILYELSAGPTPEYLDDVFGRTGRMRQRPAWTFPERWLPMADITRTRGYVPTLPWRMIALALVILAILAAALLLTVGAPRRVPAPFGPAANGLIPYVSTGDIYVGDPVTGTTRLLVGGPGVDAAPGFSPDGTRLAFVRDLGSGVDLYVSREEGTEVTRITSITAEAWAWTPDSRQLAVIHPVDGVNRLDLFDVSGRLPPTRIGAADGIDSMEFRPPLGREILYRVLVNGRYGLFTMDANGTNARTLVPPTDTTSNGQDLNGAVYSADGGRIFYQRWFPDSIQLWVMNADGTGQHEFISQLGPGWDGQVEPSPDGKWLAYWHVQNDQPATRVSVVRADGTGPIIPTGPAMTTTAHWLWSPDSSTILMMPNDDTSPSAFLLDPKGGPWKTVAWRSDLDIDWQRVAP